MRPQRTCTKQVDYSALDSTPVKHSRDFFSSHEDIVSPSPKPKRKAKDVPDVINKRTRTKEDPAPLKERNHESPAKKSNKESPAKKYKRVTKRREVDEDEHSGKENEEVPKQTKLEQRKIEQKEKTKGKGQKEDTTSQEPPFSQQDPPTQPSKPAKTSKHAKPVDESSKPTSTSTALILSPHPSSLPTISSPSSPPYVPLAKQRHALQDPVIAMSSIIGDEIKSASAKICSLESEMVLARTSKEFMKTQDHRYEKLRMKFEELKESRKKKDVSEPATKEEWKTLIAQMKEGMKELTHDQKEARKKLKEQTKELNQARDALAEEKKTLEKEKKRVEEEGREIEIEKRRMERKEIEKERQDVERERFVVREEKKELETHKKRAEEETQELARRRKQLEDDMAAAEREKRRIGEEQAREQKRLEAWVRELEAEKRKIEEQKYRWDDEKRNITKQQEEVVSTLKWQVDRERQEATKSKQDNAQLADKLNNATHLWAEHQEKMDREIEAMMKLVNTSEKEGDTVRFLCMITGLSINKISPNRFQCESAYGKSKVKFEVTIREEDVEYTPIEVVGKSMPECVQESIFFLREDWPIFLCKIISSVFRA